MMKYLKNYDEINENLVSWFNNLLDKQKSDDEYINKLADKIEYSPVSDDVSKLKITFYPTDNEITILGKNYVVSKSSYEKLFGVCKKRFDDVERFSR